MRETFQVTTVRHSELQRSCECKYISVPLSLLFLSLKTVPGLSPDTYT